MAQVGLKRAAELTGKNQSTIHRAMKAGRISFTVSDSGERMIDTSELDRVFPIEAPANEDATARKDAPELQGNDVQLAELRAQLSIETMRADMLRERLIDRDQTIADLREDRDRWRVQAEKATLLLTHQSIAPEAQPTPEPTLQPVSAPSGLRGWLHRLTG